MSDLISRKKIHDYIKGKINPYGKPFEGTAYELGLKIMRYIDSMDSAYDIYKVVKELEELADNSNDHMYESYFDGKEDGIREVIEIVKQGGVDDDVCEWEKGSSGYVGYHAYYSKCCTTNSKGLEMQTHIIADWKYCPYCGKKIKVVE